MTTREELSKFNAGVARARQAYDTETTCLRCGDPVAPHPSRFPVKCAGCRKDDR